MELSTKYDDIQTQIESDDADFALASDRVQTEDDLCNIECKLQHLLEQVGQVNQKPLINTEITPIKTSPIQLEPIKLPRFSGSIVDWQHYYNIFLELIHVRTDLTDIQKLHYLHSSLSDEALNVIKSLPITHENYAVAIDLLRSRYDSKLIVSAHHIGNVLGVKSVQQESRISISRFIDEITANINALNSLNLPVNTFEIILIHYLAQKLINYTCRLWKESLSEERFPYFSNFIKFLNTRRQLLQNLDSAATSASKINVGDKAHYRKAIKPVNVSKSTFYTHIGNNICQLCKGKHRCV